MLTAMLLATLVSLRSDVPIPVSVIDGRTGESIEDAEVRVVALEARDGDRPWFGEDPVAWIRAYGGPVAIADNKLVLPSLPSTTTLDHHKNLLVAIAGDRIDYRVQYLGAKVESLSFVV